MHTMGNVTPGISVPVKMPVCLVLIFSHNGLIILVVGKQTDDLGPSDHFLRF